MKIKTVGDLRKMISNLDDDFELDIRIMEEIYDWERDEVEDIIWDSFINKNEVELVPLLPKLEKYDGIKALKVKSAAPPQL